MGQHHDETGPDGVPDGIADRGDIDPALLDAQSRAFRENDAHVPDAELEHHVEAVHPPLGTRGAGDEGRAISLPEAYEHDGGWDAGRVGAKSPAEAQQALAERIADPAAPDGDEVRGVTYELEDGLGDPNSGSSEQPPGPCSDCGRPFSPDHDADAGGPTVRHPFRTSHPFGGDR